MRFVLLLLVLSSSSSSGLLLGTHEVFDATSELVNGRPLKIMCFSAESTCSPYPVDTGQQLHRFRVDDKLEFANCPQDFYMDNSIQCIVPFSWTYAGSGNPRKGNVRTCEYWCYQCPPGSFSPGVSG